MHDRLHLGALVGNFRVSQRLTPLTTTSLRVFAQVEALAIANSADHKRRSGGKVNGLDGFVTNPSVANWKKNSSMKLHISECTSWLEKIAIFVQSTLPSSVMELNMHTTAFANSSCNATSCCKSNKPIAPPGDSVHSYRADCGMEVAVVLT